MIASAKYLVAEINSMLIPGNAKRIVYSVMAKNNDPLWSFNAGTQNKEIERQSYCSLKFTLH